MKNEINNMRTEINDDEEAYAVAVVLDDVDMIYILL